MTKTKSGKTTVETVCGITSHPAAKARCGRSFGLRPRPLEHRKPSPLAPRRHFRRGQVGHPHRPCPSKQDGVPESRHRPPGADRQSHGRQGRFSDDHESPFLRLSAGLRPSRSLDRPTIRISIRQIPCLHSSCLFFPMKISKSPHKTTSSDGLSIHDPGFSAHRNGPLAIFMPGKDYFEILLRRGRVAETGAFREDVRTESAGPFGSGPLPGVPSEEPGRGASARGGDSTPHGPRAAPEGAQTEERASARSEEPRAHAPYRPAGPPRGAHARLHDLRDLPSPL